MPRCVTVFFVHTAIFAGACELPDGDSIYEDPIAATLDWADKDSDITGANEKCTPKFGVQFLEDILGAQLINIAGASCQPDILVYIQVSLADGNTWMEEVETMDSASGYFTVAIQRPDSTESILATDRPEVCLAFGDGKFICQGEDQELPWSWSGSPGPL